MIIDFTDGTDNPLASCACAWRRILHFIVVQYNEIFCKIKHTYMLYLSKIRYKSIVFTFFYIVPCSYFIVYNHIKIQRFMERISEVYIIFAELSYIQFIGKRYYINMHMYANVTRHTCMELFIINTLLIC